MSATAPTPAEWAQIVAGINWLFFGYLPTVIVLGTSLLLGHGVIPSLIRTGELPPVFGRLRPVFYGLGLVAALAALFFLSNFASVLALILDLYPRRWI